MNKNIKNKEGINDFPLVILLFLSVIIWFIVESELFWGCLFAFFRNPLQMIWNAILLILIIKAYVRLIILTIWHFIFSDTQKIGQKLEWYQKKYKHLTPETKKLFFIRSSVIITLSVLIYYARFLPYLWARKYSICFSHIISIKPSTDYLIRRFDQSPWPIYEQISIFMLIVYFLCLFEGRSRIIARLLNIFYEQSNDKQWSKIMPPIEYNSKSEDFHLCLFSYFTDQEGQPVLKETQYEKWYKLKSKSLFTNFIMIAPTGAGKTTTLTYPVLYQSIMWQANNYEKKVSMLVNDPKGDLIDHVKKIVKNAKREKDLLVLNVTGDLTINPIEVSDIWSGQAAWRVASWIISAWKNFQGGGNKDPYWESQSYDLVKHLLVISYYLKGKKTNLYDLTVLFNECSVGCFERSVGKTNALTKKLNNFGLVIMRIYLKQLEPEKRLHVLLQYELPENYFIENAIEEKWENSTEHYNIDPVYKEIQDTINNSPDQDIKNKLIHERNDYKKKNEKLFEKEKKNFTGTYFIENNIKNFEPIDSEGQNINYIQEIVTGTCDWMLNAWSNQAVENMGNVLSTIRPFLQQFATPEIRRILCPEEPNTNFDNLIHKGIIILPQFSVSDVGEKLSSAVNTLIKSRWQHAVLQNHQCKRPKILLMDEAQKLINYGDSTSGGDFEYMEISRSFGGISILLTQSLSALEAKASNPTQYKKIHGVIRSLLVMGTNDDRTIEYMIKVIGKEVKKRISKTVSESANSPRMDLISERYRGENESLSVSYTESEALEDRLTSQSIMETPFCVATALIFDGEKTTPFRCALRPFYWKNHRRKWSYMEKKKFKVGL